MAESAGPLDNLDKLDPEKLQAFLDMLVETGVAEFEGYGLHVRFTDNLFSPEKELPREAPRPEVQEAATIWERPELWPGGKAPKFPGK